MRGVELWPTNVGRSREGAWIEILRGGVEVVKEQCRSREGAWIEIGVTSGNGSSLYCRSREGAWIEIRLEAWRQAPLFVAPVRERGLK